MTNPGSISILGCGWLGMPLAKQFLHMQWSVKGSTTSPDKLSFLEYNNIRPYLIQLGPELNEDYDASFFDSEVLIINIPPGRRKPDVAEQYPRQMESVASAASKGTIKSVLFVSSTSVYPDMNREVTEEDADTPDKDSGKAVLKAEQVFLGRKDFQTTVVRFCGLYGPERNPGRFLAGKKLKTAGDAGVNLIHLQDCIQIITSLVLHEVWGEIFNACADQHPAKKDFYFEMARLAGMPVPEFTGEEHENFKIINSSKLKERLNYQFSYPDPLKAIARHSAGKP